MHEEIPEQIPAGPAHQEEGRLARPALDGQDAEADEDGHEHGVVQQEQRPGHVRAAHLFHDIPGEASETLLADMQGKSGRHQPQNPIEADPAETGRQRLNGRIRHHSIPCVESISRSVSVRQQIESGVQRRRASEDAPASKSTSSKGRATVLSQKPPKSLLSCKNGFQYTWLKQPSREAPMPVVAARFG